MFKVYFLNTQTDVVDKVIFVDDIELCGLGTEPIDETLRTYLKDSKYDLIIRRVECSEQG